MYFIVPFCCPHTIKVRVKMKPTNLFEEYGPRYDKHRKEVVLLISILAKAKHQSDGQ
jgi:hypothetical protein